MKNILTILICGLTLAAFAAQKKIFPVISTGADGRLVYDVDEHGNRVPDFSSCGYAGGDRPIPDASVCMVVSPVAGDETARIQKAIDYVATLPPDTNGVRGAVLLLKGRHEVYGGLQISNSGVVMRGQGTGADGTVLVAAGIDRRTLIRIIGKKDFSLRFNISGQISDDYLPVGASGFHLQNVGDLKTGDTIRIIRPSTKEWIDALGMTEFGGGLGDWRLVWHPGSYDLVWDRKVRKVEGNLVTIDSPVTTAMETNFGGGTVKAYSWPGRIENVGVENLRLESSFDAANPKDENHSWCAITMENAGDVWVRQVAFEHFAGSAVAVYESCQRVSVADCVSLAPVSENGGGRRDTFFTMGQQTLFLRCRAEKGRHDFSTGHCAAGPNAFVQCESDLPSADTGAMESWSSGTLYDNMRIDGGGLDLMNRGGDGEGAGWAAANSVLWNCIAAKITCEKPPGAQNWAFGSWGEFGGNGLWRNSNASVKPESLFSAQLADRLGNAALKHIDADKVVSSAPENAKSIDQIPDVKPAVENPRRKISVTNGWLVCEGKLLVGDVGEINWWRGNLRPSESANYGVDLTRFAPGRIGAGFTDNLDDVADGMVSENQAALDHHYGLWYDRRREDHERVRRVTGDVWPPFYEQPFARSGQGAAWDGLSKYDLTKFNPWYWSRLEQFGEICAARGLVLFNENYFQHNTLEDGAHWVDFPWRSMNNINETGFKEPLFEIEKRTVMADQFYDVTNPVRRRLHEGFIRQNLANFTNIANVIQFTSAEFSGPLAFEQFWLDTIGDWEDETKNHPLIALAAPKNVQDAILADAKRAAVVDIIAFRYWWMTDNGVFAPEGGMNLTQRQSQRLWKNGTPTDLNLATMAAEYRAKFPAKPVIAVSEQGADLSRCRWAYLCAGGSLPNLPSMMDAKLLAAISGMHPWPEASQKGRWVLREAGKQFLIFTAGTSPCELDLSAESGAYQVRSVDERTGAVQTQGGTVQTGGKITLPAGVIWLTLE